MITIEDLSKDELAELARKLLAREEIARQITELDLLDVRAAVLRDRADHAWLAHRRASEVVEKLSGKPNVNEQTWKRAMNKEERLFAEYLKLRDARDAEPLLWREQVNAAAVDRIDQIPPTVIGYLISDDRGNYAPWPQYYSYEEACKHCEPGEAIGAVMSDHTVTFEV